MPWEEMHGGIWSAELDYGDDVVFIRHVVSADLIAYLYRREDRTYVASVWRKTHYRKWRLPFWTAVEPAETFTSERQADLYLTELVGALAADERSGRPGIRYESEDFAPMGEQAIDNGNVVYLFPPRPRGKPSQ
ncbi:hypothetical protein [Dyella sp.]|uniref:hypothetical protein n=1 Tax=Dyella sp. TaxID=1869338 RepID=UPI002ED0D4A1